MWCRRRFAGWRFKIRRQKARWRGCIVSAATWPKNNGWGTSGREREQASCRGEVAAANEADPLEIAETLAAVEELDDELREVLVARVWGQLSLEEVARLCGVSTATAFRRYEAALKALRAKLETKCENRR